MALLDDVLAKLVVDSVVDGATTWKGMTSFLAPSPDKAVAVTESVGRSDQENGTSHDYPSFQVRVRGEKFGYQAARTQAQSVFDSLNNGDINNTIWCYARHPPAQLSYDENNRPIIVINFDCMRAR